MNYVVGLTGGIGSGKSTVADRLAALGAAVVDADQVAHEMTAPGGAALPALREAFGAALFLPDGALDRAAMRQLAFADAGARQRLERILHPMIRTECAARVLAATAAPYVVLVVPLLVESAAYAGLIDRVLVVDCPVELQLARVMARSGLAADEVRRIMATQASREARRATADDVLLNSGEPEALAQPVAELHARYLALAHDVECKKPQEGS